MIRHIVAIDNKRGFAKAGVTPWDLPKDKRHYRREIQEQPGVLLMGRGTLERVGQWISEYRCFVLTRNTEYRTDKATVIHDIEILLDSEKDIWVIGGAEIYAITLPLTSKLYITEIDADFDCDTFYPEFADTFALAQRSKDMIENNLTFRFNLYRPRKP